MGAREDSGEPMKRIITWIKWRLWWRELKNLADNQGCPVNKDDPESYRDMFDDGYDTWDTLVESMRE